MTYATIDDLRSSLGKPPQPADDPVYAAKMLHKLPEAKTVDRAVFLLQRVAGKRVLEFGASGPMHEGIVKAAARVDGIDRLDGPNIIGFDLDDVSQTFIPDFDQVDHDIIVCGEVLEHLSNPGWFLARLHDQFSGTPLIITVPNAFAKAGRGHLAKGIENVNKDHVAWYSPKTLKTLLERHGYTITEFYYYNGDGPDAEGLIAVAE
jgi:2-polyprenyl-3-methyl-5-hydroxy-6-metoxy-1,4-benzoquinol methylase